MDKDNKDNIFNNDDYRKDKKNKDNENDENNEEEENKSDYSLDDLQKQIQDALKNINANSFVIPMKSNKQSDSKESDDNKEDDSEEESSKESKNDQEDPEKVLEVIKNFDLKPKEVKNYLDKYVIKQEEAKRVLSVAVCDHYNHIRSCLQEENEDLEDEYTKQNILLLGPTGVGKTYLVKCLANLIGVPFVKADATKYSATGYVGNDVEDLVRDLVKISGGNTELAQYGIIYIDEIDKITAKSTDGSPDVSGRGVQINLLKLMEDSTVNLQSQTDMTSQFESVMEMMHGGGKKQKKTINTKNILFIISGSFDKLSEVIKQRIEGTKIGFNKEKIEKKHKSDYLKKANTSDFIQYGFEPEFIGRVPIRVTCSELLSNDLKRILTESQGSILKQYKQDFAGYGIDLNLNDTALTKISEKAYHQQTGARGLMTVMESIFRDFKFELPSTDIETFKVDKEVVESPAQKLKKLLSEAENKQYNDHKEEIEQFISEFYEKHNFKLSFNKEAKKAIIEEANEKNKDVLEVCRNKFKDFSFGLNLISDELTNNTLKVTAKMVKNPDKELSERIGKFFKSGNSESNK